MDKRFNLIDEPWIPVADKGRVSLRQVFTDANCRALGGNPVEKIALMKLLLAIAQAAATPEDEAAWRALGAQGLAEKCLAYLDQWHDQFDLYGDKPFLQMPAIAEVIAARTARRMAQGKTKGKRLEAEESGLPRKIGAGFYPDLPSTNNTQLSRTTFPKNLDDAEKAVFLVTLMNFAFGGKRVESDITSLGGSVLGTHYSAPAGPSLGGWDGQLHCLVTVDSILETVWLNLLTSEAVQFAAIWPAGVGRPVWEDYPASERDEVAVSHKTTYQACLVALSRFVLLSGDGVYYLDGINYPSVKNGWSEPTLILDRGKAAVAVRYASVEKKPWRELEALLAANVFSTSSGFECSALRIATERVVDTHESFWLWCGGIKVSSNSGDQSVKGDDDFVESAALLASGWVSGKQDGIWFSHLQDEMSTLDEQARNLWGRVTAYFAELGMAKRDCKKPADKATQLFWQLCERDFQRLLDHCEQGEAHAVARRQLRRRFAGYAQQAYDRYCPKDTARQLDAWARCRPNHGKYLQQEA